MIDCKEIIDLLLEDEEDEDADLVKEVSPVTPQDVQNWLISAGFKDMDGSWVKFMSAQAISVSKLPEDFYSLSYYRWSGEGWVFSHRYESNGPGLIDTLSQVVDVPVQESEEDFADDDESAFEFKDALGAEDKHEIYSMLDQGILGVSGNVSRHSSHYVHENSTTYEWQWEWYWSDSETDEQREEQKVIEERTERQLTDLEAEITKDIRRWNHKIYKEIEAAYDDHLSDEQVAENIRANEYDFEEDGTRENGGGFQYDQLSPKAQTKAREWWVNTELEMGDTYYAEPVIAEWKWLLKNKGFDGVEIAWSGFSGQGDGASFTASSVDLKRYLTGPDPIDFPERDREQLSENEEDDDEDIDPKDVYDVRRRNISAIRTKADYAEYEARVAEFFTEEGINNLTGITDNQGYTVQDEFSSRPCEVCHRPRMAGTRIHASGYSPKTREIKTYWICPDCEYYAAYGTLDDTTMMDLKDDPEEIQERYAGAEKERGIWYHGTSAALIPKILSQGLVPEPKRRAWARDPYPTSVVQATRRSLSGIYVTANLGTATLSAQKVAQRDKTNQAVIVMELQPRSMVADEDDVNMSLKAIEDHLSDSAYHHIWPYFMEVYGDRLANAGASDYRNHFDGVKLKWVNKVAQRILYSLGSQVSPELEKRVKELLFNEGFRIMLERMVSYVKGWDESQWQKEWAGGFGEYGSAPPKPDSTKAEADWLAFSDRLSRAMKDKARPAKTDEQWRFRDTGRVLTPVRFNGSNRIICIIEIINAREPDYHSRMIVHYGKPPAKLIEDWTQNIGPLDKSGDIVYKNQMPEPVKENEDESDLDDMKDVLDDPAPPATFVATSSWGNVTARVDDGTVTNLELFPADPEEAEENTLDQIMRFDVQEWRDFYKEEEISPGNSIDILDLGFWTKGGEYEGPEMDWREEFRQRRAEQQPQGI